MGVQPQPMEWEHSLNMGTQLKHWNTAQTWQIEIKRAPEDCGQRAPEDCGQRARVHNCGPRTRFRKCGAMTRFRNCDP